MASYYGVIFHEFWTGPTGRELRKYGRNAQVLGLYLATNEHANMLGLYRLFPDDVTHETGIGETALAKAFDAMGRTEFARFDAATSFVWVRSMARIRLGLARGSTLQAGDHRRQSTNKIYRALDANPFLGDFYDVNHRILLLEKRRPNVGEVVALGGRVPAPVQMPAAATTEREPRPRPTRAQRKAQGRVSFPENPWTCPHTPRCGNHVTCDVVSQRAANA